MTGLAVSAPGKAVVAGEYAVLAGAPAISMALDRRARVYIEDTEDSTHCVFAPGYLEDDYRFRAGANGDLVWDDELPAPDSFALLECVWRQAGITKRGGLSITLDTSAFFDTTSGSKLGLGSSAALATALASALTSLRPGSRSIESLAVEAHRDFQQGAGSGIDIATAIHGGVIEYQIGQPATVLRWPGDLAYQLLWSAEPAATAEKLHRLAERPALPSGDRLAGLSHEVTGAWKKGDITGLLSTLQDYVSALEKFSVDQGLGIFEAGHQELADKAKSNPTIVYKPCGAGGGDIGIVLGESVQDVDLFTVQAVKAGFIALDTALDVDGVVTEDKSPC